MAAAEGPPVPLPSYPSLNDRPLDHDADIIPTSHAARLCFWLELGPMILQLLRYVAARGFVSLFISPQNVAVISCSHVSVV